ncbi:GNAT family N-acetyltransferase [bacterium]|nr:GNAT family N-acetyltransferase [bacterium]
MIIHYTNSPSSLVPAQLAGFFSDWPNPPSPARHLAILRASFAVWLAMDGDQCVGYINALSDGILTAYIPLLEVLPECRHRGIGTELVRRMVDTFRHFYAIDIVCDESVAPFYEAKGFSKCVGMIKRNTNAVN